MKKLISLCMAILLAVSMFSVASVALAEEKTEYQSTRYFLDALDGTSIDYTYVGVLDSGNEAVIVSYDDDDFDITIYCLFDDDHDVYIYDWDLLTYTCDDSYAYQVCNELNDAYHYVKFYVDTEDKTINAQFDMILNSNADTGSETVDAVKVMRQVIRAGREKLLTLK